MDLPTWLFHSYHLHAGTAFHSVPCLQTPHLFRISFWVTSTTSLDIFLIYHFSFIHIYLFLLCTYQESTDYLDRGTTTNFSRKGPSTIAKIKEALNFMRNQHFEVQCALLLLFLFLILCQSSSKCCLSARSEHGDEKTFNVFFSRFLL